MAQVPRQYVRESPVTRFPRDALDSRWSKKEAMQLWMKIVVSIKEQGNACEHNHVTRVAATVAVIAISISMAKSARLS